mmetsp:Transcript_56543/g.165352  ORF Transcript_56543/g.165352 Transcript_56543/m.165352 type:complete len:415 (-) Transcript_56543:15-1259(-)
MVAYMPNSELVNSERSQGPTDVESGPPSPPGEPFFSSESSSPLSSPQLGIRPPPRWKGKPKEGLESPLLGRGAGLGTWDKACTRLGLSGRTAFNIAVVSALFIGILIGVCCSAAVMDAYKRLTPRGGPQIPWRPYPLEAPKRTTVEVHGRNVTIYQPSLVSSYPMRRVPAVIVLHGSEDTPQNIERDSGFSGVAEASAGGFVAVYPEMLVPGSDSWGFGAPWETAFFQAVIDKLVAEYSVRRHEVYLCGHSNGGSMALFMQNNRPELFQAIAAVEAGVSKLQEWRNESRGRPTMVVWNHNDNVLSEYGGEGLYRQTLRTLRRHDPWHRAASQMTPLPAGDSRGVQYAEKLSWEPLPVEPPLSVISWSSVVPTHNWLNPLNVPGAAIDASSQIWDFFQAVASFPATARGPPAGRR